jgi:signal transduction histidine kinase
MSNLSRRIRRLLVITMVICVAQVVYWVIDEHLYTQRMTDTIIELHEQTWRGVAELRAAGVDELKIVAAFPGRFSASAELGRFDELNRERRRRLRRFVSEGTFFLFVLFGGLGITLQFNRREAEIHRRQENMIAAVSHEFKSPIASLRLSTETLERKGVSQERSERVVARMLDEIRRLERLVFNFLDASRIQQGRLELLPEPVVLETMLSESIAAFKVRSQKEATTLRFEGERDLTIYADAMAAKTCVDNVLDNALKATAGDSGSAVELSARRDGAWVHLEVRDDGCGFAPDEAEKIFEKFYRVGDELRRESKGTGLGLYLVQALMTANGGRVSAVSEGPGRGARVELSWPAAGSST